ncbi:nucleotide disphospho-sugar-binding domain-containing protein [Nocardiopsis ganjiahuensis]|uniref:nucleotide disphospho-sugar-binding domain-containing protein n=1 Tax=Nocardiopsis ganjiahuensis TaxID=239984 RepID=UPI0003454A12|nr:glycosyltransferase [Nocardiopsis ganjiahuensis]
MRALLLTQGTRGDVQPFLALALALEAAGHTALVAGPSHCAPLAAAHGVDYHPTDDGITGLTGDPELAGVMDTGLRGVRGAAQTVRLLRRIKDATGQVYEDIADAAESGADIVVHTVGLPGQHIAEYLGARAVPVGLQPSWIPTRAFPAPGAPWPSWMPGALNGLSYRLVALALRGQRGAALRLRRERLGLGRPGRHSPPDLPDGRGPLLQAFSRHLLPDGVDYPSGVRTTGFWFPPPNEAWTPSPELEAFLGAGEAPVFIGFSSAPTRDPAGSWRLLTGAARRAGVRAVIATGWGGVAPEGAHEDVLALDQAPHERLFPRCAAVVHHGGAGTTGAALAGDRPQVICPFWGDQPFWAQRAHATGVATPPLRGQDLTEESLAAAIGRAVSDQGMAATAERIGARVREEEGVLGAVRFLEETAAESASPHNDG